jgi:hypothetical protein
MSTADSTHTFIEKECKADASGGCGRYCRGDEMRGGLEGGVVYVEEGAALKKKHCED